MARVVHYGLIYVVCGLAISWKNVTLVQGRGPAEMGIGPKRVGLSLLMGLGLSLLFLQFFSSKET